MTRALVTGSTGGVGANLIAALNERGIEVVGLRRRTSPDDAIGGLALTPVIGDILEPESLRQAMRGIDWVFHAAAIADDWHYSARQVYQVNVEGTRNVLAAAYEAGVQRFVLTGSAAALGVPVPGKDLIDETHQFNLKPDLWPYGHSKHLALQVLAEFVDRGLHAVSVLPTAVMGPRDVKFISGELIVRAVKRQVFPFPDGGLNFIDIRDVAQGHIAAAERGKPGERYLLGGHNLTHTQTLETIAGVLRIPIKHVRIPRWLLPLMAGAVTLLEKWGVELPIERARVLLSGKYMYYDSSKAQRELGLAVRPFVETVRDTYLWYAQHHFFERRGVPSELLPRLAD